MEEIHINFWRWALGKSNNKTFYSPNTMRSNAKLCINIIELVNIFNFIFVFATLILNLLTYHTYVHLRRRYHLCQGLISLFCYHENSSKELSMFSLTPLPDFLFSHWTLKGLISLFLIWLIHFFKKYIYFYF